MSSIMSRLVTSKAHAKGLDSLERIEFTSDVPERLRNKVTDIVERLFPEILHVRFVMNYKDRSCYSPQFRLIALDGDETAFGIGHELTHWLMDGTNYDRGWTTIHLPLWNTSYEEKATDLYTWARSKELVPDLWYGDGTYMKLYYAVVRDVYKMEEGTEKLHNLAKDALEKFDDKRESIRYVEKEIAEISKKYIEEQARKPVV